MIPKSNNIFPFFTAEPIGIMKDFAVRGYICPYPQLCKIMPNPDYQYLNFQNIFTSLFTNFVSTSQESWTGKTKYLKLKSESN